MIKLDEMLQQGTALDLAKTLINAINAGHLETLLLEAIPHQNTSKSQLNALKRALKSGKPVKFQLRTFEDAKSVARYEVLIDLQAKQVEVNVIPNSLVLYANKFEVL